MACDIQSIVTASACFRGLYGSSYEATLTVVLSEYASHASGEATGIIGEGAGEYILGEGGGRVTEE